MVRPTGLREPVIPGVQKRQDEHVVTETDDAVLVRLLEKRLDFLLGERPAPGAWALGPCGCARAGCPSHILRRPATRSVVVASR